MKPFVRPIVDVENLDWNFFLKFPEGDDFVSPKHIVDPKLVLEWCEQMLPYFHAFPDIEERRLSEKSREAFILWE